MEKFRIGQKANWVVIKLYEGSYRSSGIKKVIRWTNMQPKFYLKWEWYFKYRAALFQVQNPKRLVTYDWGIEEPSGKTAEQLLNQQIKVVRANITRYTNFICKANEAIETEKAKGYLFFNPDTDPRYKETIRMIEQRKGYIEENEKELKYLLEKKLELSLEKN